MFATYRLRITEYYGFGTYCGLNLFPNGTSSGGNGRYEAFRLYRKAADMGLSDSQFNLGTCYDMGWGVEKNQEEALKWYRKASAQGCKFADDMIRELTKKK